MAVFRDLPWWKVPGYVLGQLIGAWAGAILVFGNYFHAIDIVEGQKGLRTLTTASLFGTYAVRVMRLLCDLSDQFCSLIICLLQTASLTR
jgi:aquaglyceroporin related protein